MSTSHVRNHYGLTRVDGTSKIRYRRAQLNLEVSQAHGAVTVSLTSDDVEVITGIRIVRPGTAIRWRR